MNILWKYIRIIRLYFRIWFFKNNIDKSIVEIMSSNKNPLDFFDAHIFSLPNFIREVKSYDSLIPKQKTVIKELLDTFPLYIEMIKATEEKWYICKIRTLIILMMSFLFQKNLSYKQEKILEFILEIISKQNEYKYTHQKFFQRKSG